MIKKLMTVVGAASFAVAVSTASVFAATCPEPGVSLERVFELDPSPGCYAYGTGNINGNPAQDPLLNGMTIGGNTLTFAAGQSAIDGLVLLDKSDSVGNLLEGAIQGWVEDATSGFITITNAVLGYTNLVLAIKSGNNLDPAWATFNITGPGVFEWSISPRGGNSHVNLYGTPGMPVIPLPAAGWLLIGGIGALVAVRRKKKAA